MKSGLLRWVGPLSNLLDSDRRALLDRRGTEDLEVRGRVTEIVERVRREGDAALLALAAELDKVQLTSLEIPRDSWRAALGSLSSRDLQALQHARDNIERVHQAFRPSSAEVQTEPGVRVGRRPDPLGRVGIYAPGGRAAYPSSVLMGAVPARVAGVREIILCSPPNPSGLPSGLVLAAAEISKVDRVFAIGGAGAIAAMAFGTQSVPRVDRIIGPGNAYVAEAKLQIARWVGIDSPAGPSEILVIADSDGEPAAVARELLAQAEHDPQACAVALAIGQAQATQIVDELKGLLANAKRRDLISQALSQRSAVLWVDSLQEAIEFSNRFAPEHLMLAVREPEAALASVRNAGTVFLGISSSVAFGDYLTGSNHVLPTGGLARTYSGLSTSDFIRWTSYQQVSPAAADRLAPDVEILAEAEGLFAHAAAARAWRRAR
jgi:histidinol dehydrogenase